MKKTPLPPIQVAPLVISLSSKPLYGLPLASYVVSGSLYEVNRIIIHVPNFSSTP